MNTLHVKIAKVGENLFEGDANSLHVPGSEGDMTVLARHEPFITPLKKGVVTVKTDSEEHSFDIERGVLEVSNNQAIVLL